MYKVVKISLEAGTGEDNGTFQVLLLRSRARKLKDALRSVLTLLEHPFLPDTYLSESIFICTD